MTNPAPNHRRVLTIGLLAAALGVGLACGSSPSNNNSGGNNPAPTTNPAGSAATTQPPAPGGIHGDGVFLVPTEVKPGTYRATVPADSFGCYWERLKGTSGSFDDIIANGNGNPGERMTVTIKSTDKAFHTQDCGDWQKIS